MISAALIGCKSKASVEKKPSENTSIVYKNLPITIIEADSSEKNYKISISSNGIQKETIAMRPIAVTLIAKKGTMKFEMAIGATYRIEVYPTNLESIEELYKEPKKEPTSPPKDENNSPLLVHEVTINEDTEEIELKIPKK